MKKIFVATERITPLFFLSEACRKLPIGSYTGFKHSYSNKITVTKREQKPLKRYKYKKGRKNGTFAVKWCIK